MKLEEAASILGVSLDDITVDGLKQTYKKLALAWESEKSADQNLKGKYQQVSEAYQKIISAMEDREPFRGDDSHEVAAFMRMFMDMVGISESDSIPAAMTFGMMFGSNQSIVEEWSTDEDGEGEYDDDDEDDDDDCDEDEDDEEYLPDEYFDEYAAVGPSGFPVHMSMPPHPSTFAGAGAADPRLAAAQQVKTTDAAWEPQVKQYSNMNLKDQLNSQRAQIKHGELADDDTDPGDVGDNGEELTEAEKERKLKLAKKRAEKRKKQKEKEKKKSREANGGGANAGKGEGGESKSAGRYHLDFSDMNSEDLTGVIQRFADQIVAELTQSVTNGQLGKVNQILSYDFVEEMPALVATETVTRLKEILPSAPLLHQCVTNLTRGSAGGSVAASGAAVAAGGGAVGGNAEAYNTAMLTALAARRLEVAKYLLAFNRPPLELGTTNASGLSVLHYAVANGDLKVTQAVLRALAQNQSQEDRKPSLNVNSRCHRQGWAPLHYAVDRLDVEAMRLLAQHGANLQATVATDRRQTPMELAKQKLKAANGAGKAAVQAVIDELQSAMDRNKATKEAEAKIKRQNSESHEAPERKAEPAATTTAVTATPSVASTKAVESAENTANSSAAKADKKKKKKDKAGSTTTAAAPAPPAAAPKPADTATSLPVPPPTAARKASETVPAPAPAPTSAPAATTKNKKGKGAKAAAAQASQATAVEPSINPIAEMSVSSRDELVDRLLAMGFRESDCLQAIALYGTDIDRAISWLCEKPVTAASTEGDAPRASEGASNASATASTPSVSVASTATSAAAAGLNSAQKLQKEKEELRRINQAWNQKAIEEKRKAEALKKQQELEKQQAELLAKQQAELQRQQQAQQEFLYQQHLQQQQQYLALQQAHLQTFYAAQQAQQAQQAAMFGGPPGMGGVNGNAGAGGVGVGADGAATAYGMMGNTTSTANYPLGSLGHMANMLASNAGSHAHGSASSFGSHLSGVPGVGGSSANSGSSLQSLSGAMAMAMGPGAGSSTSASSMGAHASRPSLRDAMSLTYSSPNTTGMASASPRLGLSGSSPPRTDALGGVQGAAGGVGGGAFGLGLGGGQNSLGLFGSSSDPLASLGGFPGGGLSGSLGGSNSNNSSSHDVFRPHSHSHSQEALVDGALELSAGAKPFIPRFGSSTGASGLTTSPASSTLSGPSLSGAFGVGSSLGSNLGGLGLGAPGLGGSWNTGSGISLDGNKSDGSKMPGFLSSLLPSELILDEDAFDASGIIPDLDSFLLNDN